MPAPTLARRATRGGQYAALVAYLLFLGFPLLWLISVSLKDPRELVSIHPSLIPQHIVWQNFADALGNQALLRSAVNSLIVSVVSMVLVIIVAVPTAYALTRFKQRARKVASVWILTSQVFPVILIVIPVFLILRSLHLLNSLGGLILIYLVWTLPFALWMLMGFVANIPQELEEAAEVDGAGRLRIVVSVVLPLLAPGIVATALFSFISCWNEFFFALVLLQDPGKKTISLTLANYMGTEGLIQLGPLAAGALMATVPSLVFFGFMQRRLTSGMLAGAVKG
jgi:multiple sugar transport system permease protein